VKLWAVAAGKEKPSLHGHKGAVAHVAFAPDGRTLASVSWDETVRLWDAATGAARGAFDWQSGRMHCLAFSPDGMTAAVGGSDHTVVVRDVDYLDRW